MHIRVLGCSGAIGKDCRTTSFLLDDNVLVDAGTGVGDLTLDELRRIDAKMRAQGVTDITPITHGNAWSIYASDPEGNGLEAYLDTPWHVSQPHGRPFDLSLPDADIEAFTQALIQDQETFASREQWMRTQEAALMGTPR